MCYCLNLSSITSEVVMSNNLTWKKKPKFCPNYLRILQREEILRIDTPLIHLHGPYEFTNSRERFHLITSLLEFFKNIGQSMGQ